MSLSFALAPFGVEAGKIKGNTSIVCFHFNLLDRRKMFDVLSLILLKEDAREVFVWYQAHFYKEKREDKIRG